jgi:7-cyano-7-deazaguanine reductase
LGLLRIMEAKYLGKTVKHPVEELDTFPAPDGVGQVTMTSDEVASSCPITGQPDFYTVKIEYQPNALCIESKSLKLYLWGFATRAVFAEKMAADILDRVVADIQPKRCRVITIQKARGGISIETIAEYPNPE